MSFPLEITPPSIEPDEYFRRFGEAFHEAEIKALNETAKLAREYAIEQTQQVHNVRASSVRKRIEIERATKQSLFAVIRVKRSRAIALIAFAARKGAAGASVEILRGKRETFPGTFIAPGLGGNRLVFLAIGFKRMMKAGRYKGKIRVPLISMYGPSIGELFTGANVEVKVRGFVDRNLRGKQAERLRLVAAGEGFMEGCERLFR